MSLFDAELANLREVNAALRAENERLAKEVNHWREARRTALLAGDVLKAENERLRKAVAGDDSDLARLLDKYAEDCQEFFDQVENLRAENERLRQDAERYRWVRAPRKGIDVLSRKSGDDRRYYRYGKDLDEYIDSDMARESER